MVSSAAQQGSFVLASAPSNFMDPEHCISSLIPTQQITNSNTTQGLQLPTQLLLAPAQGTPLMLSNNLSSVISLVPQSQQQPGVTSGNMSAVPATGSSTGEQFLSAEGVGLLNNNAGNSAPLTPFAQLLQQSPASVNHQIVNSSPIQVSFMSQN